MLPHSHSNATARYMSHTHPACTRQHAGHTHTPPHGAARQESWKKGTHTGREGTFRQELSIEQDRVQHKAQFKFVPQNFFFFPFLAVSNTSIQRRQQRERERLQTTLLWSADERNGESRQEKRNKNGKKKEQDERERRLISTLRSPSLTAPAQSFKVCHHLWKGIFL